MKAVVTAVMFTATAMATATKTESMGLMGLFSKKRSLHECGVLAGSADRHTHILYGVDDGIRTLEESLAVLEFEEALGVREVWCTPHVMEDVPNSTEYLRQRFDELSSNYSGPLKLHLAAEYMLDTVFESRLAGHDFLTMEDNTLLMETSTVVPPYDLKAMVSEAMSEGYRPLFAHPERYRFLELEDYKELHSMGVRFQLNIASLTGYYGRTARIKSEYLLKNGFYSAYGSDCHRLAVMKEQYSCPELTKEIINKIAFP